MDVITYRQSSDFVCWSSLVRILGCEKFGTQIHINIPQRLGIKRQAFIITVLEQ